MINRSDRLAAVAAAAAVDGIPTRPADATTDRRDKFRLQQRHQIEMFRGELINHSCRSVLAEVRVQVLPGSGQAARELCLRKVTKVASPHRHMSTHYGYVCACVVGGKKLRIN